MAYTKTNANVFSGLITGVSVGGVQVGWTGNSVAITVATETVDLTGGQSHTPIATNQKSKKYQLRFSLREYSFESIAMALGQAASAVTNTGSSLTITGTASANVVILFEALNEQNSKYYYFNFPVCKFAGSGEVNFDSENQGDMVVTFDLIDSSGIGTAYISAASTW